MRLLKPVYLSLIYILLYFPILILVIYSFNESRFSQHWHGFSLQWYIHLFQDHSLWLAFFHSLTLGGLSSFFSCCLSLIFCLYFFIHPFERSKGIIYSIFFLIILPDLVLGVALLLWFNVLKFPLGFFSLLVAHITFCIPFTLVTLNTRVSRLDINIYYSALDLGASKLNALFNVILPLLWPALFSAFLLGFTLSFDDVIISYFVSGPEYTILPLTLYSLVRGGTTPELNALCSIILLFSVVLVLLAHRYSRKSP